jgi:hypothetical protein
MRYKYTRHLNDLKDLKHIEWFVNYCDSYEFQTEAVRFVLEGLKKKIRNKNIYYSEIVQDYETLIHHFNNDPYNYMYETSGEKPECQIFSDKRTHYFVTIQDKEGTEFRVPYKYIVENSMEHDVYSAQKVFDKEMADHQGHALENFEAVRKKCMEYWKDGGVESALNRYATVGNGKGYKIPQLILFYVLFNMLLFGLLHLTQIFGMLFHLTDAFDGGMYSVMAIFPASPLVGWICLGFTVYFIVLDVFYTYGLFYILTINEKYKRILKYHNKFYGLYQKFVADYNKCMQGITSDVITKQNNRKKVYLPLLEMAKKRYNFMVKKKVKENGVTKETTEIESILVPKKIFYSQPIQKRLIWILIVFVVTQGISVLRLFY